jgi:hypothetical protein
LTSCVRPSFQASKPAAEEYLFFPPPEDCIRVGVLQKKSIDTKGIVWTKKLVALGQVTLTSLGIVMAKAARCATRGIYFGYIHWLIFGDRLLKHPKTWMFKRCP